MRRTILIAALLLFTACMAVAQDSPPVRVWSDRAEYYAGDSLTLRVSGKSDFFGRLLYVTASGELYEIVPASPLPGQLFKAGQEYAVPALGEGRALTIAAPFGREKVVLAASLTPLPELPGKEVAKGVRLLSVTLDAALRALGIPGPGRSLSEHGFETLPGDSRGFTRQDPEAPVDMTGAAGREGGPKKQDLK